MLPGKWPVSDFLVDRATEDYDMMLSLNASEIEAIKNKVITCSCRLCMQGEYVDGGNIMILTMAVVRSTCARLFHLHRRTKFGSLTKEGILRDFPHEAHGTHGKTNLSQISVGFSSSRADSCTFYSTPH